MSFSSYALQYQRVKANKVKAAAPDLFITEGGPLGSYPAISDKQLADIQAGGTKVVAYVETSIAEDYRTYWNKNWTKNGKVGGKVKSNAPDWLKDQPNNKFGPIVDYTDPDWQQIVIDQAVDLVTRGYDGVFLDDVAQYFVKGATGQNERGQALSMLKLVNKVAKAVHAVKADATIVVNGDPYILTDAKGGPKSATAKKFLKNIDAMLLESHFGINGPYNKGGNKQALKYVEEHAQLLALEYAGTPSQNFLFHKAAAKQGMLSFAAEKAAYDSLAAPSHGGTDGNNKLLGTDAGERIDAMGGRDWLNGLGGNDRLKGGTGKDKFVFSDGFDQDRITDFENNRDTLVFSRDLWNGKKSKADLLDDFARINGKGDTVFNFGGGDKLTVEDVGSLQKLLNDMDIV